MSTTTICDWVKKTVMGVLENWTRPRILPFYAFYFLWAFTRPMSYALLHDPIVMVVVKTLSMWYLIFYVQVIKDFRIPFPPVPPEARVDSSHRTGSPTPIERRDGRSTRGEFKFHWLKIVTSKSFVFSKTKSSGIEQCDKIAMIDSNVREEDSCQKSDSRPVTHFDGCDTSLPVTRENANRNVFVYSTSNGILYSKEEEISETQLCDKQILISNIDKHSLDSSHINENKQPSFEYCDDITLQNNDGNDDKIYRTSYKNCIHNILNLIKNFTIAIAIRPTLSIFSKKPYSVEQEEAYKHFFTLALVISSMGDAFMIFPSTFISGVLCYGSAHVLSIIGFQSRFTPPRFAWLIYPYSVTGVLFILVWIRSLRMMFVILAYAFMLTTVLFYALANLETNPSIRTLLAAIGAQFYVWSDSMIGLDKWLFELPFRNALVWSTYFFAQMNLALSV